jgi:hypothetical protein
MVRVAARALVTPSQPPPRKSTSTAAGASHTCRRMRRRRSKHDPSKRAPRAECCWGRPHAHARATSAVPSQISDPAFPSGPVIPPRTGLPSARTVPCRASGVVVDGVQSPDVAEPWWYEVVDHPFQFGDLSLVTGEIPPVLLIAHRCRAGAMNPSASQPMRRHVTRHVGASLAARRWRSLRTPTRKET